MEFRVSHEVLFEIVIEAPNRKEAEIIADKTPHTEWHEKYVVREECIAIYESPRNPHRA